MWEDVCIDLCLFLNLPSDKLTAYLSHLDWSVSDMEILGHADLKLLHTLFTLFQLLSISYMSQTWLTQDIK